MFNVRMGNPDDPKDVDLLSNASPLFKANAIKRPLLIGQGANDPRVNKAESESAVRRPCRRSSCAESGSMAAALQILQRAFVRSPASAAAARNSSTVCCGTGP